LREEVDAMCRFWFQATCLAVALVGLSAWGPGATPSAGQTVPSAGALTPWVPLVDALRETMRSGRPSVVIVTKRTDPGSQALRASLPGSLQALSIKGLVLAEMDTETFGDRVARIGITEFPTVLVYGRGGPDRGLTLMGHLSKPGGANAVAAWVGKLRPAVAAQPADPAVVRTNHYPGDQQAPSPQAPPVAPAPSAPVTYAAPPVVPVTPVYTAQAPQPVMVSPPAAPVVVQPPTQTIVMAPSPPPNIVFAALTAAAPVAMAPAPAAQPSQLFLAPAPTAAAPAPTAAAPAAFAPAAAPMAFAPAAAAPVAFAPAAAPMAFAPAAAAPAMAPTVMAPVAAAPTAGFVTLIAPSLLNRLLGAIGEHLLTKKQPRIQLSQSPALAPAPTGMAYAPAPQAYAPAPQAYAPAPQAYAPAPQAYASAPSVSAPAPAEARAPYPAPSPQSSGHGFLGFFHKGD